MSTASIQQTSDTSHPLAWIFVAVALTTCVTFPCGFVAGWWGGEARGVAVAPIEKVFF
jgi:hypothetical protein